ncbi:MAG: methyl-accepting chemotaxis protein, partial [Nitrospinota bacterium]|nr:methyl-accepting chemotaxis protein [Nitrospinota bacterium]
YYSEHFPRVANAIQVTLVQLVEKLAKDGEFDQLDDILDGDMGALNDKMSNIVSSVAGEVTEALEENEATLDAASRMDFVVFTIAVLFLLVAFVWFARGLLNNINGVTAMIRDIAEGEGDLTRRLDTGSKDEICEMAFWFNRFVENLQVSS